jgi:hypothetical protein
MVALTPLELAALRDRVTRERLEHSELFIDPEDVALRSTAPKEDGRRGGSARPVRPASGIPWPPPWPLDLLAEPSEARLP